MSILYAKLALKHASTVFTYKVVKFMVNVKLVEKSVKSHVGRVIDRKVISQYSTPGITFNTTSMKWLDEGLVAPKPVLRAIVVAFVIVRFAASEIVAAVVLAVRVGEDPHSMMSCTIAFLV